MSYGISRFSTLILSTKYISRRPCNISFNMIRGYSKFTTEGNNQKIDLKSVHSSENTIKNDKTKNGNKTSFLSSLPNPVNTANLIIEHISHVLELPSDSQVLAYDHFKVLQKYLLTYLFIDGIPSGFHMNGNNVMINDSFANRRKLRAWQNLLLDKKSYLILENCELNEPSLYLYLRGLKLMNSQIKLLDLSNNNALFHEEHGLCIKELASFICNNSSLKLLNLESTNLTSKQLEVLVSIIKQYGCFSLESIILNNNPIGHESLNILYSLGALLPKLKSISLRGCNFPVQEIVKD